MVADYLLEPGERIHNLDDLAKRFLGHTTIKIEELIGTGKNQKRMDEALSR
jgi:DNA polymerase-1